MHDLGNLALTVLLPLCVVQAAGPSKNPNAPVPPRPKNRFDTRLQELEASLSGGSGGGGRKAKNVSGAAMTGGLLLTSQEYTAHVSDLRKEVEEAWSKDEKVAALKAAVQVLLLLLLLLAAYSVCFMDYLNLLISLVVDQGVCTLRVWYWCLFRG